MFPLHFLFSVLVLFRLCKRGKDVVPVDDPDKVVAVKDRQPAHVMFHEQFCSCTDRLPRCDSHDIRDHNARDRGSGMIRDDCPHPP